MKTALRKSALREIKNTKNRFFSIFSIVAIGVGFFSGVKAAAPDMRITADKYYDDMSLMNYRLVSTYGFDEKDIEALEGLEGAEVYPSYYTDVMLHSEGATPQVARVFSFPENNDKLNKVTLKDGRLPEKPDECIVSASDMEGSWLPLGSKVTFSDSDGNAPEDMLSRNEYTVVGAFISPMFVDKTAFGSTTVGNGSISAAVYVPQENFCVEYNTEVYLRIPGLDEYICYNDEYKDETEAITEKIEAIADSRQEGRYEDIISEANETLEEAKQELADAEDEANAEIADGEKELADAKEKLEEAAQEIADGEKELADGEQELIDARAELDNGYKELAAAKADYEKEIADAEEKIAEAEKEIAENEQKLIDGEKEYNDGLAEYEKGYAEFSDGKKQYEDGLAQWQTGYAEYEAGLAELEASKAVLDETAVQLEQLKMLAGETNPQYIAAKMQYDEGMKAYEAGKVQLDTAKLQLDENKAVLDATAAEIEGAEKELTEAKTKLDEAKAEIDDGRVQLNDGKNKLEESRIELAEGKAEAEKEFAEAEQELAEGEQKYNDGIKEIEEAKITLADGKKEYEDGLKEYEDGEKELAEGKAEAEEKIADAKEELAEAEQEIADLEKPEWYIFTRDDNPGYSEYGENANRINNIAAVFPVFFILVAALVCLTTMTRMVEDQRTQIGTLKALGYTNGEIIGKYMFYATAATLSGAIFGVLGGMKLFPFVIITAYGMMYNIPELCMPVDIPTAVWAIAVSVGAILVTVWFTCKSTLKEHSAQLMRPKAPKIGKRIFLEYITPLWKRFNFSSKVTSRNLFRYKRKMFMSTVGIAGCTALLMTGFALFDSINDIISLQYGEIQYYDGIVAFDGEKYPEADKGISESVKESVNVFQKQMTVKYGENSVDAYIAVPSDPERFADFFTLRSRQTGELYTLSDGDIYIDEKMSLLLGGVDGGDTLAINKSETEIINVKLTAFFENYPGHFVYMTEKTYIDLFGEKPVYNSLYFSHDAGEDGEDALAEKILETEGTLAVSFTSDMKVSYEKMLETLSAVIIVIIVSAGSLAYVVMYNLTNINITERIREIATLKVLGFYDKEVDSYIFRENIILTLMGTAVGLVLGIFLARFVITTAEVDLVMFGRNIYPRSYILSALFTLGFSVFVTLVMHKKLKNVDMIEALKSIE